MTSSEASHIINEKRVFQNLYENTLYSKPKKAAKLRIGDKVRISEYKRNVFHKGYTLNWTEETSS